GKIVNLNIHIQYYCYKKKVPIMKCIFCNEILEEQVLLESKNYKVVFDIDPIQFGHLLIISKNHVMDIRDITPSQSIELIELEKSIINVFEKYFSVTGISVIQNNGKIMDEGTHFHVHLIPRYTEDNFWGNQNVKQQKIPLQELQSKLKSITD
ncbi:HIT family protein, partial [Kurthia gibsonii]|uniref:HIT family protein n=1 Tax=Kurthia gibsonii TaxID=33946 RepID=UPI00210062C4